MHFFATFYIVTALVNFVFMTFDYFLENHNVEIELTNNKIKTFNAREDIGMTILYTFAFSLFWGYMFFKLQFEMISKKMEEYM